MSRFRPVVFFSLVIAVCSFGSSKTYSLDPASMSIDCTFPSVVDARHDVGVIDVFSPQPIMVVGSGLSGSHAFLLTSDGEEDGELGLTIITDKLAVVSLPLPLFAKSVQFRLVKGSTKTTVTILIGPLSAADDPIGKVVQELDCYVDHLGPIAQDSLLVNNPAAFASLLTALDSAKTALATGPLSAGESTYFSAMDIWLSNSPLFKADFRDLDVASGIGFLSETFAIDRTLQDDQTKDFDNSVPTTKSNASPTKLIEFDRATVDGLITQAQAQRWVTLHDKGAARTKEENEEFKKLQKKLCDDLKKLIEKLFDDMIAALTTDEAKEIFKRDKEAVLDRICTALIMIRAGLEDALTRWLNLPQVEAGKADHDKRTIPINVFSFKFGLVPTGASATLRKHEEGHLTIADALYDAFATFIRAFIQNELQGKQFKTDKEYKDAAAAAKNKGRKAFTDKVGDNQTRSDEYDAKPTNENPNGTDHGRAGTEKDQTDRANKIAEDIKKMAAEITPKPPQKR